MVILRAKEANLAEAARLAAALAFALAALALTSPARAQSIDTNSRFSEPGGPGGAQLREGNIYGHRAHQPTQAEDAAAGIAPPSVETEQEVEKEVRDLLRQGKKLDRASEQQ